MNGSVKSIFSIHVWLITWMTLTLVYTYPESTNKDMNFQLRLPRMNLQNKTLKIASVTRIPFQNITPLPDGEYIEEGFTFEIINQLASFFNFSYKIVMPEDNTFGKLKEENGTKKWNGMIKQLLNKEADIAAAMFTITEDRKEVVDFTKTIYLDGIDILMQHPKESDNTSALLAPFSINVWVMIIVSFFAMGPVIYAMQVLQRKLVKLDETTDRRNRLTLAECVWFVYAGLVKQGSELSPIYDSTRILLATWWIFTLIVTAFYTANLTAFLTLPYYKTINSLDMLLQHPETTWLVKYGGALDAAIEEGHGEIFQKLRSSFRMGYGKHSTSDEEARSLIEKGGYVYLHETLSLKYLLQESYQRSNGKCLLALANQNFFQKPFGFAYPKGSPYAFAFNEFVAWLRTSGLIEKWKNQYMPTVEPCVLGSQTIFNAQERPLKITDLTSAFFAYLVGSVGGLCILLLEMAWSGGKHSCLRKFWNSSSQQWNDVNRPGASKSYPSGSKKIKKCLRASEIK